MGLGARPDEREFGIVGGGALAAGDCGAAVAKDDSAAAGAGAAELGLGAGDFAAVAAAAVATDRKGQRTPNRSMAGAARSQRVGNLVENGFPHGCDAVGFDQMSRKRDPFLAVVTLAETDLGAVELKRPLPRQFVLVHQIGSEGTSVVEVHVESG